MKSEKFLLLYFVNIEIALREERRKNCITNPFGEWIKAPCIYASSDHKMAQIKRDPLPLGITTKLKRPPDSKVLNILLQFYLSIPSIRRLGLSVEVHIPCAYNF